jgi:hypothetical protein|nr:MAG TPA: hypothetical protein [Caudoviricetes sp.]
MKETLELEVFEYPSWNKINIEEFLNQNEKSWLVELIRGNIDKVNFSKPIADDFLRMSLENKNVLIIITRLGVLNEKVYILNGKYYIAIGKVVFDEFDIGKLN